MNLPEYKRALAKAVEMHGDSIDKAHAVLREQLAAINNSFFDDELPDDGAIKDEARGRDRP